jgi:hypothetical protein
LLAEIRPEQALDACSLYHFMRGGDRFVSGDGFVTGDRNVTGNDGNVSARVALIDLAPDRPLLILRALTRVRLSLRPAAVALEEIGDLLIDF